VLGVGRGVGGVGFDLVVLFEKLALLALGIMANNKTMRAPRTTMRVITAIQLPTLY